MVRVSWGGHKARNQNGNSLVQAPASPWPNSMRIGLIGWYGRQNAGDERILHAIRVAFSRHDVLPTNSFDHAWSIIDELNRCDLVLLGGGGLILRGFGVYAGLIGAIKPRFAC